MAIAFNPLSGTFDIVPESFNWKDPVADFASLPASGNTVGDARVTLDTGAVNVWTGSTWISSSGISGIGSAVIGGTNKSVLFVDSSGDLAQDNTDFNYDSSTNALTVAGIVYANGGLDRSSSGTLSIGTTVNSTVINIGNSGATVNIQGTTLYENVTQLEVTDPLITLNKGGGAGSAQDSGIQLEENSLITAYTKTSLDRNSWLLKAPNTAGEATITPGAGGITINQSSHDPVTLGTANGLSLSTQQLSLQAATSSTTGALTSTDWSTFNNKANAALDNLSSVAINTSLLPGVTNSISLGSGSFKWQNAYLTANLLIYNGTNTYGLEIRTTTTSPSGGSVRGSVFTFDEVGVPGALAVYSASDGTADATATGNVYLESGNKSAGTGNSGSINIQTGTSSGGTRGSITLNGLDINLNAANQISANSKNIVSVADPVNPQDAATKAYVDANVNTATGDISQTSFTAADNQSSPANVTGFTFSNASVRSFTAFLSIVRGSTYAAFKFEGIQKGSSWEMSQSYVGDDTGITFTITTAGQVQYQSTSTGSTGTLKFRAYVTNV